MIPITTEEFIKKLKIIHNDEYDYSLVDYVNMRTKIKIICKKHGMFEQSTQLHFKGYGCPKCKFDKLKEKFSHNKEKFIENAIISHGDKYDYHLVDYVNAHTKVKIICHNHGIFEQTPNNHISKKQECPLCSYDKKKLNYYNTLEKLKVIHNNKYDYSLNESVNSRIKLKVICPIHGIFEQKLHEHINGRGCPKCFFDKITKSESIFIKEFNLVHNNKYDYHLVDYENAYTKVIIIYPIHGRFKQNTNSHLNGSGCPVCRSSKGEKSVKEFLEIHNIDFIQQKKFKNLKNMKSLKFDFYLTDYNTCIEYDGEQHFKSYKYFGGDKNFNKIQLRDIIKNNYCENNGIKLVRIKYDENINRILNQTFNYNIDYI